MYTTSIAGICSNNTTTLKLSILFFVALAVRTAYCVENSTLLSLRGVEELTCDGIETFFEKEVHDEAMELSYNKKMYRVMSNILSLQSLSMRYSGKPVNSKEDLNKACPTSLFKWKTGTFSAFGRNSTCKEKSSAPTQVKCTGDWKQKPNAKKAYNNDGKFIYIWTDGVKYTLHLHCLGDDLNWIVSSTSGTPVGKRAKSIVFKLIKGIGFDPKNAVDIPHADCDVNFQ